MTSFQQAILTVVTRYTGKRVFCVRDIAYLIVRQPGYETNAAHSRLISRECKALEAAGVLRRMDDGKPIVWCVVEGHSKDPL